MRDICYETNLFGDPTLDIWTAVPQDMNVILPENVNIGDTEIIIQTDVSGARVAILLNNELLARGLTGSDSNLNLELESPVTSPYPLEISIIAHNYHRYYGDITVVSEQPCVVYQSHILHDDTGNGNGEADYGETVLLDIYLYNGGDQDALNTELAVFCDDEYITIIDGEESVGQIIAGAVVELPGAICFMIGDNIPDQHITVFTLIVNGESRDSWSSEFSQIINAPELEFGGIIIDDSESGNNNGILESGETAEFVIQICNTGHAISPAGSLQLFSQHPDLEVEAGAVNFTGINVGEITGAGVTVTALEEAAAGTEVSLFCNARQVIIFWKRHLMHILGG